MELDGEDEVGREKRRSRGKRFDTGDISWMARSFFFKCGGMTMLGSDASIFCVDFDNGILGLQYLCTYTRTHTHKSSRSCCSVTVLRSAVLVSMPSCIHVKLIFFFFLFLRLDEVGLKASDVFVVSHYHPI